MAFKRTRTGCLTCREDGYKCDEGKPSCGRCIRLGKDCKGYGLKLKWQNPRGPQHADESTGGHQRKRKTSSTDLVRMQSQNSIVSAVPRSLSNGLSLGQAYLLDHWCTTLAGLITMAPTTQDHFHAHITPMITYSTSLRSAVCFMAAHHLNILRADSALLNTALRHQIDAVSSLRKTIQTNNPLLSLAVIMILQTTDRLFTTNSGVNHLEGAKAIINQAGPKTWDCDIGAFLLNLCCYHDAVVSVSGRTPPILGLGGVTPYDEQMDPMKGLQVLWATIGRISSMESQHNGYIDIEGESIEAVLLDVDASASREGDAGETVHAYKEAAYIYLHRVWHNVGSPHPRTLRHARDCLDHLFRVPVASPLVSAHAWPIWTAGCETIDSALRDRVRERIVLMYEARHLPSLKRLAQDIEDVWKIKDEERGATGVDKVDCVRAILAMRKRGADLV
ncbi:fungal-specific transcription factor domain-containing protein [Astrocystis sublimbata]|nr:fungal-specific transcription factor domain-containing protein [Astrocystis sublimbata]